MLFLVNKVSGYIVFGWLDIKQNDRIKKQNKAMKGRGVVFYPLIGLINYEKY